MIWRKVIVHLGEIEWSELSVAAWDMVDDFWLKHDQPPIYFARYSLPPRGDSRVEIQTQTKCKNADLQSWFLGPGVLRVDVSTCDGSDAHAAAYLLARELRGKDEALTKDALHWALNMMGYSYTGEIRVLPARQELTEKERAKGRSESYHDLSPSDQWAEDKRLGILDWDGL